MELVCPLFGRYILPCPARRLGVEEKEWQRLAGLALIYVVNVALIWLAQGL